MRRTIKWLAWALALLIGVPLLVLALVVLGANLGPGRNLLVSLVPRVTAGQLAIAGLSGRSPDELRIATVELRDAKALSLHP
jgi:translocation and assembly module TamB